MDERQLTELIRLLEEHEAPVGLKGEILQQIEDCQPPWYYRLVGSLRRPFDLQFGPVGLVFVSILICAAFCGGMFVGRHNTGFGELQTTNIVTYAADAGANFLIGRGLLAGNQSEMALAYFQKAVELEPSSAEYLYWQGVAAWAAGKKQLERQSYLQTTRIQPGYLPSLLNLGHNYLENGQYDSALKYYRQVLEHEPDVPEALYNSALAYLKLDNQDMEKRTFRRYLKVNRTGKWANRAVAHLHQMGDYSYRSYRIGTSRVVLNASDLLGSDPENLKQELAFLVQALSQTDDKELHIISYNQGKGEAAKKTALQVKKEVLQSLPPGATEQILVSWFDSAELLSAASGKSLTLSPSLLIFTIPKKMEIRRKSI